MARNPRSIFLPLFLSLLLYGAPAVAQPAPGYVYSGPLLPLVLQMPGNSWLKVNTNLYSDVWTPPSLEPLDQWRDPYAGEDNRAMERLRLGQQPG